MKSLFLELDDHTGTMPSYVVDVVHPLDILMDCSKDLAVTWQAVLNADNIYFSSIFLGGESLFTSSEVFNLLMAKAVKDNISGKYVYCCSDHDDINYNRLNSDLFHKCFQNANRFFVRKDDRWTNVNEI